MAVTGALNAAERSYPMSEVRGRSQEDPMPRGCGQEEVPHVQGQGQQLKVSGCDGTGRAEKSYPRLRPGAEAWRSYPIPQCPRPGDTDGRSNPMPEARGSGQEDQPHVQGAMAAGAQEGLEELYHFEGQEGQW